MLVGIINVGRDLFGEQIKPKSIDLSVTDGKTYNIVDDEDGNLYDNNFHQVSQHLSQVHFDRTQGVFIENAVGSGSEVGNVFYNKVY